MTILPKAINRFNAIPVRLSIAFPHLYKFFFFNFYESTKEIELPKQSWKRKMELGESGFLISVYTTKLQSSKQYDTVTEREI